MWKGGAVPRHPKKRAQKLLKQIVKRRIKETVVGLMRGRGETGHYDGKTSVLWGGENRKDQFEC